MTQKDYLAYLMRLWRSGEGDEKTWRALLESPGSRERQGFACLQDLFDFIQAQTQNYESAAQDSQRRNDMQDN